MRKKRKKLKLGDIYEIPLPSGENAYGRLYEESVLAIYKKRGKSINEIPEDTPYDFFVGVYTDLLEDGKWKVVSNRKFAPGEDTWGPPQCVIDAITGEGSLYYKGEILPCSYEECKDLEIAAAWDRNHVVDRLMGNDIWEKSLGKPKKI